MGCDSIVTLNLTVNQPSTSTLVDTSCGVYTFNGKTYAQSGSYKDTLLNSKGCDSIVSLTLTIKQPSASTTNHFSCSAYTWHGKTYTVSGTYKDTLVNAVGCDSVATLVLTIPVLNTGVTISNATTLTGSMQQGASYQWIDCLNNNMPVQGATSSSFSPTTNGSYALIVTMSGCSDTSNCVQIAKLGVEEATVETLRLTPNPGMGVYTLWNAVPGTRLHVYNVNGLLVYDSEITSTVCSFDISMKPSGMYYVKMGNFVLNLIKQ
jgi:hypothetical protein